MNRIKPDVYKLNFEMKRKELYERINSRIEECDYELKNLMSQPFPDESKVSFYKAMKMALTELISKPPKTNKDLKQLEWMFNDGYLRNEEEIRMYETEKAKSEYLITEMQKNDLQCTVSSICMLLILIVAPGIAGAISFRCGIRDDIAIGFVIFSLFAYTGCYFVFMFLALVINYIIESKYREDYYYKIGQPPAPNVPLLLTTLMYGISVWRLFKKGSKKK